MEVGTFLLMVALAYSFGVLWYDLLPGRLPLRVWRVAAYPFLGIWVGELLLTRVLTFDPEFGGLHLISAALGSLVAVVVDWIISGTRRPAMVPQFEAQPEARAA